jgi:hypothetical protein
VLTITQGACALRTRLQNQFLGLALGRRKPCKTVA